MNQNTYNIKVRKARSLTIIPQMRNIFTREIMAANANRDTILLDNVPDITIKKIVRETSIDVYIDNNWNYIPVRTPESVIDQILNTSYNNGHIDKTAEPAIEVPVEEEVEVEIPSVEEIPEEAAVQEESLVVEKDDTVVTTDSVLEEAQSPVIAAYTEVPTTPINEISQQFKSVPRNNGNKHRNNNNSGKK